MAGVRLSQMPAAVRAALVASGRVPQDVPVQEVTPVTGEVLGDGPWQAAYVLHVALRLRSKSNRRRYRSSAAERAAWKADRAFDAELAAAAAVVQPPAWQLGEPGSVLRSRPTVVMAIVGFGRLDAANLTKSIPDALEGVAYLNDASVTMVCAAADRAAASLLDGGLVGLALLPADAPLSEQAHACAALTGELVERAAALRST